MVIEPLIVEVQWEFCQCNALRTGQEHRYRKKTLGKDWKEPKVNFYHPKNEPLCFLPAGLFPWRVLRMELRWGLHHNQHSVIFLVESFDWIICALQITGLQYEDIIWQDGGSWLSCTTHSYIPQNPNHIFLYLIMIKYCLRAKNRRVAFNLCEPSSNMLAHYLPGTGLTKTQLIFNCVLQFHS